MEHVAYREDGTIAELVLNRPDKLNALTPEMLAALADAVARVDRDTALRALVLRGEGRTFCVGADIDVWSTLDAETFRTRWVDDGHRAFDALARCRVPVVAAIHGMAFGGGLELALAADLRVMEEDATVSLPELSLGTVPGWGGTRRLAQVIGAARAKHMLFTAARIDGRRAEAWGLASETCPVSQAREAAMALAQRIASLAPISIQIAKRLVDANADSAAATLEMLGGMATQATQDMHEGIRALREKRSARFEGR